MADHTVTTHRRDLLIAATVPVAGPALCGPGAATDPAPDPAITAYHRLRAAEAVGRDVAPAEEALIAARAAGPAGIAAKLMERAAHQGWFAQPEHYETRLIHSALAELARLEGRA